MNPVHVEASLRVAGEHAGMVESLMMSQGALAVTMTDHADQPLLEPGVGETPLWGEVEVTGLYPSSADLSKLGSVLCLLPGVESDSVIFTELAGQEWERAWLDQFHAMKFGSNTWIVPSTQECPEPDAINIRLDPGLAFGTGTHPTTRLCLEWIDAQDFTGLTVVDYGCGSGILGIAAALKGASVVLCFDHDPQAVAATMDNARRNGVEDRVEAVQADTPPDVKAEVVMSNILAGILVKLAPGLQAMVKPAGRLALTGILAGQANQVAEAYQARFGSLEAFTIDDWVLLCGTAEDK